MKSPRSTTSPSPRTTTTLTAARNPRGSTAADTDRTQPLDGPSSDLPPSGPDSLKLVRRKINTADDGAIVSDGGGAGSATSRPPSRIGHRSGGADNADLDGAVGTRLHKSSSALSLKTLARARDDSAASAALGLGHIGGVGASAPRRSMTGVSRGVRPGSAQSGRVGRASPLPNIPAGLNGDHDAAGKPAIFVDPPLPPLHHHDHDSDSVDIIVNRMITEIERVQRDSEREFAMHDRLLERLGYSTDEASIGHHARAPAGRTTPLGVLPSPSTPHVARAVVTADAMEAVMSRQRIGNKSPLGLKSFLAYDAAADATASPVAATKAASKATNVGGHLRSRTLESDISIKKATFTRTTTGVRTSGGAVGSPKITPTSRRQSSASEDSHPRGKKVATPAPARRITPQQKKVATPASLTVPPRPAIKQRSPSSQGPMTSEDEHGRNKSPRITTSTATRHFTPTTVRTRIKAAGANSLALSAAITPSRKASASCLATGTFREEVERLRGVVNDLKEQLRVAQLNEESTAQMVGQERGARERLEREVRQAGARIEEVEQALQESLVELQAARSDLEVLEARSQDTVVRLEEARKRAREYEDEAEQLRDELEQLRGEVRAVKSNERFWENLLASETGKLRKRIVELEETISSLKSMTAAVSHVDSGVYPSAIDAGFEEMSTLRDANRPSTELERLRDMIAELSEEKEQLQLKLDTHRADAAQLRTSVAHTTELALCKDQIALLTSENDELKRSRERLEAQIQILRIRPADDESRLLPGGGLGDSPSMRARALTSRTYSVHTSNQAYSSPSRLPDRIAGLMRSNIADSSDSSPTEPTARVLRTPSPTFEYLSLPRKSPSAMAMSLSAQGKATTTATTTATNQRNRRSVSIDRGEEVFSTGDGATQLMGASASSPNMARTIARKRSNTIESDGNFGERWTRELQRLIAEKDMLKANYATIPLTGGGAPMRRLKEDLADRLETVEEELSSTRRKLRSIGLL